MSFDAPDTLHDASDMSHVILDVRIDANAMSHDAPEIRDDTNDMSHGTPELCNDATAALHDAPDMSHDTPAMSHDTAATSYDALETLHDDPATPRAPVTIQTQFGGGTVIVDDDEVSSPCRSNKWYPGVSHSLNVSSPQSGASVSFTFSSWSDGLGQNHNVTASLDSFGGVWTANFTALDL